MSGLFDILRDKKTALEIERRVDNRFVVRFSKDGSFWNNSTIMDSTSKIEPGLIKITSSSKRISPT